MRVFNVRTMQDFDIYSKEVGKKGKYIICGRSTIIDIGDVIEHPGGQNGYQVKEIERRDHKGVFRNPEDKKNSFYTVTCESVEMRDIYEQLKQEEENVKEIND